MQAQHQGPVSPKRPEDVCQKSRGEVSDRVCIMYWHAYRNSCPLALCLSCSLSRSLSIYLSLSLSMLLFESQAHLATALTTMWNMSRTGKGRFPSSLVPHLLWEKIYQMHTKTHNVQKESLAARKFHSSPFHWVFHPLVLRGERTGILPAGHWW